MDPGISINLEKANWGRVGKGDRLDRHSMIKAVGRISEGNLKSHEIFVEWFVQSVNCTLVGGRGAPKIERNRIYHRETSAENITN